MFSEVENGEISKEVDLIELKWEKLEKNSQFQARVESPWRKLSSFKEKLLVFDQELRVLVEN